MERSTVCLKKNVVGTVCDEDSVIQVWSIWLCFTQAAPFPWLANVWETGGRSTPTHNTHTYFKHHVLGSTRERLTVLTAY